MEKLKNTLPKLSKLTSLMRGRGPLGASRWEGPLRRTRSASRWEGPLRRTRLISVLAGDQYPDPDHNETPGNSQMRNIQFTEKEDLHSPKTSTSGRTERQRNWSRLKETGNVRTKCRMWCWPGPRTEGGKEPRWTLITEKTDKPGIWAADVIKVLCPR